MTSHVELSMKLKVPQGKSYQRSPPRKWEMIRPMGPVAIPTIWGMIPVIDQLPGGRTTMIRSSAFHAEVMAEKAAIKAASRDVIVTALRVAPTTTFPPSAAVVAFDARVDSFGRNL